MSLRYLTWFHTPMVSGWEGFTSRAHRTTFTSSGIVVLPSPPLVGSLYKSQIKILLSFLKRPNTAFTYFSIRGCVRESMTRLCPGLGDQAHAYHPFSGFGCLPTFGSFCIPKEQSSNNVGINFILCLSQIVKNLSRVFKKYSGLSS